MSNYEKREREERERNSNNAAFGLRMTDKELKDAAKDAQRFIDQVNSDRAVLDLNGNVIITNTKGMSDGAIVLIALGIGQGLGIPQTPSNEPPDPQPGGPGLGGAKRTPHGRDRKKKADKGDTHRQIGDANRTIREGRRYQDTETGNNVYVRGNKVVITNQQGTIISQFKNTRANTLKRIERGKWAPIK